MPVLPSGTVLVAALMMIGALVSLRSVGEAAEYVETINREFRIQAGQTVRIENPSGRIDIRGTGEQQVRVEAKKKARWGSEREAREALGNVQVEMNPVKDGLAIATRIPRGVPWKRVPVRVDYTIAVPRSLNIETTVASGDVVIRDIQGRVKSTSASGDVSVAEARGGLQVVTASGDVSVERAQGALQVSVASGDVRVRQHTGDVRLKGTSGDVETASSEGKLAIDVVSGDVSVDDAEGDVAVKTISGNARVNLRSLRGNAVKIETTSGDVRLKAKKDSSAKVSVRTLSGRIHTRIRLVPERLSRTELKGTIGSGQGRLDISTTSGDIEILSE
jgi:DUF4097 and DUF4098 domain-containing protein YvlB